MVSEAHQSLRVFISYARSDSSAFAEELLAGLEAAGFDPFLDRHDIAAGEDWQARLGSLLQQADTVVYVLSPASVGSERCAWEIARAEGLAKRLIPVVARDVAEADTPEKLRRLNYIFFSPGHTFGQALRELAAALRTDVPWIREHTRLAELSERWREDAKPERLLRGSELEAAKTWMAAWKAGAPPVTDLHREFIHESEAAEQLRTSEERQRLDEMARAQADTTAAQADRERALKQSARMNRIWGTVAGLLTAATLVGAALVWQTSRQLGATRVELQILRSLREQEQEANDLKQAQLQDAQKALVQAEQSLAAAATGGSAVASADGPRAQQQQQQSASVVREALRQTGIAQGWDTDIFWCAGPGETGNRSRATLVQNILTAEQTRQQGGGSQSGGLSFPVGRVRTRSITEEVNARPGYQVHDDVVRAEPGEAGQSQALRAFVAAHQGPALTAQSSGMNTPYYLSVFMCAAGSQ